VTSTSIAKVGLFRNSYSMRSKEPDQLLKESNCRWLLSSGSADGDWSRCREGEAGRASRPVKPFRRIGVDWF